jgi:hypothetical protein
LRPIACLLAAPLVFGALLFEHVSFTRQRLQTAVDNAAESGAAALIRGEDVDRAARRKFATFGGVRPEEGITIESPPAGGRFRRWKGAVRVRAKREWRAPLLPRSLGAQVSLDVSATAAGAEIRRTHQIIVLRAE